MRYLFNILAISLLLSLVSCEKQERLGNYVHDGNLNIILSCANMEMGGNTKSINEIPNEGTGPEYQVKDYWLLQYDSKGVYVPNSAKYVEVDENTNNRTGVLLPKEGEVYYCLFIANTHNSNLATKFKDSIETMASMSRCYKGIESLDSTYNKDAENPDLVMSGIAELNYGDTELICKLYRNIAKLTVTLENAAESGLTIKSINIKNIPAGTLYADVLLKKAPLPGVNALSSPYPNSESIAFFDYELDNIALTSGNTQSFVWYLPRNNRGTENKIEQAYDKNQYAPELATYIEIFATANNDTELYRYRFYVGDNPTYDFNVEPNKHYNIPIKFVDKGDVRDSRISDFSNVKLSGKSNCYIINPLPIEYQAVYTLPLTKIFEFWNSTSSPVNSNTEWVAEVIWQDQAKPIMEFVTASGNSLNSESALQFKVKKGAEGNAVIGVREKESSNYLWSWHIWITDYNPDEYIHPWTENKYVYKVPGGEIHRYAGEFWRNNYKDKYIMDRNLGALSADYNDGLKMTSGFMYQYGRKDPFPAAVANYYDINGNEIGDANTIEDGYFGAPFNVAQGPVALAESVKAPYKFIKYGSGDWIDDNPFNKNNYTWNAPTLHKSMYDPCPEGWRIPMSGVYDIFYHSDNMISNNTFKANVNTNITETNKQGLVFRIDTTSSSESKDFNIAYFPATSVRATDGKLGTVGITGALHILNAKDSPNKYYYPFYFHRQNQTVNPSWGSTKTKAVSVRCIREKVVTGGNNNSEITTNNDKTNTEDYKDAQW